MLKFTTTGVMCRDCHEAERAGTPPVVSSEIVVPPRATRESTPEWKAFADYFEKREGVKPTNGDSRVDDLYTYYAIGAWDKESGRHND